MWFRKKLRNRAGNTVGVVPRSTVGTGLYTVSDVTKTAINWVLNTIEWIGKTASSIKEAVHNAFTKWKWYHKLWRAPASLIASPFMAIEWVAETLWGTSCNIFRNTRDTIAHPFINVWNWIKWMWSAEWVWEFKFSKIEKRSEVSPKNRLAGLFWTKAEAEVEQEYIKFKKEKENRKKEKENRLNERKAEREKHYATLKQEREDWRNSRKAEQEKYHETIKKEREALNKQKDEFNNRISLLEKEKKNLEAALKNAKTEAEEAKNNVVKFTPKVEKKEVNTESKAAPTIKIEPKPDGKWATNDGEQVEIKNAA